MLGDWASLLIYLLFAALVAGSLLMASQVLGTRGELGYVLTDVAVDYPKAVLDELAAMEETVRVRLLS